MENKEQGIKGYISRLERRLSCADRVYGNIRELRETPIDRVNAGLLNGKLGEVVNEKYTGDYLPCHSTLPHVVISAYRDLREKGQYQEVQFFDKVLAIIDMARHRCIDAEKRSRKNLEQRWEIQDKHRNLGGLEEEDIQELVKFELEDQANKRANNNYLIVIGGLLGPERISTINDMRKSIENPIVKLYNRKLTEKDYNDFMSASGEEIIDNIIVDWQIQSSGDKHAHYGLSFRGFEWQEIPEISPREKVLQEIDGIGKEEPGEEDSELDEI